MKQARVIIAATSLGAPQFSADLFWRTGRFSVPDPMAFFEIDGKGILLLSSLELERGQAEAKVDEVVSLDRYTEEAMRTSIPPGILFLKERGVEELVVPQTFPYSLGALYEKHFKISLGGEPFYPARALKRDDELREIEGAQRAVERAVGEAKRFLTECMVKDDLLYHTEYADTPISSAHLRSLIDTALYADGYLGVETIVSCGLEAADPHALGSGNLKAKEPLVLDVFPRSLTTLYFADQTRTFFKGEPSEKLKRMYEAVRTAQEQAISEVHAGALGSAIEKRVRDYFEREGFPTTTNKRPVEGFIHSLGHGVGIDIHEEPRLSVRHDNVLTAGNVVTVEPGLYYRKETDTIPAGGIRIEDMVLVTENGCRNLTTFPKSLDEMILS